MLKPHGTLFNPTDAIAEQLNQNQEFGFHSCLILAPVEVRMMAVCQSDHLATSSRTFQWLPIEFRAMNISSSRPHVPLSSALCQSPQTRLFPHTPSPGWAPIAAINLAVPLGWPWLSSSTLIKNTGAHITYFR